MFGENLATEDLFEDQVNIGDVFRVGSSHLVNGLSSARVLSS